MSKPFELYLFTRGNEKYGFTSRETDYINHDLLVTKFKSTTVSRNNVTANNDINQNDLTLKFPRTEPFILDLLRLHDEGVWQIKCYRATHGSSAIRTVWVGRVSSAKADGNEITIKCESAFTSLKRNGLRACYSTLCRHDLYGTGCGVAKKANEHVGYVTALSGTTVTVAMANNIPVGLFTGGMLGHKDTFRFITSHTSGDVLTLSRPMSSLSIGDRILAYPGCDHTMDTCENIFNNKQRFGGFPLIPTQNPFSGRL